MTKHTPKKNLPYVEPTDYIKDYPSTVSQPLATRLETAINDLEADSHVPFYMGAKPLQPGSSIEALTSGVYTVWNAALAGELGLPEPYQGSIEVHRWGSTGGVAIYRVDETPTRMWATNRTPDGWAPWIRQDAGASAPPDVSSASGFKTVPLALTRGNSGLVKAPISGAVRIPIRYNAPIIRWRLHITDGNPRSSTRRDTGIELSAIWLGDDAGDGKLTHWKWLYDKDKPAGDYDDLITPWSTEPIGDDQAKLISFGYTATTEPIELVGGCYRAPSRDDGHPNSTSTFTRSAACPFDIWLEVETYSTTPAVAILGSSSSIGVGATLPIHDSPISQYMRAHGGLPVHYGHSGDTLANNDNPFKDKFLRWAHLSRPDSIIDALGSNDVFSGSTVAQYQALHAAAMRTVTNGIVSTIYSSTIPPRTSETGPVETVRRAVNTWLKTQPNGIRQVFDFSSAVSTDDETLRPEFDYDGTHCNTAGYAAMADAISSPVTSELPA